MDPFNVCVPVLHAFMINGNKVTVFLCVNVNDGNRKEEASEKKEISESDVRSIQNIGTLSYQQCTG